MRQASSNYKNKKIRNAFMTYSKANPLVQRIIRIRITGSNSAMRFKILPFMLHKTANIFYMFMSENIKYKPVQSQKMAIISLVTLLQV